MQRKHTQLDRRNQIVEAAIGCFVEKGFHATSMRDIALAASVSLGNLYNYFPSKQALIAEVAKLEQTELAPLLEALAQSAVPTLETIRSFLAAYGNLCRQREWAMLSAECLAEMARSPALIPAFERNRQQLLDTLTDAIERGTLQGPFQAVAPARLIGQTLLDLVESDALRQALIAQESELPANQQQPVPGADGLHRGVLGALLGV